MASSSQAERFKDLGITRRKVEPDPDGRRPLGDTTVVKLALDPVRNIYRSGLLFKVCLLLSLKTNPATIVHTPPKMA